MQSTGFEFTEDLVQTKPFPIPRHTFIIAEIGINHNSDVEVQVDLPVRAAVHGHGVSCGAK